MHFSSSQRLAAALGQPLADRPQLLRVLRPAAELGGVGGGAVAEVAAGAAPHRLVQAAEERGLRSVQRRLQQTAVHFVDDQMEEDVGQQVAALGGVTVQLRRYNAYMKKLIYFYVSNY
jgi:Leu/Phe-tRNA-protein transferase